MVVDLSIRGFQPWHQWLRGRMQNVTFAIFGFSIYRLKRRLGMKQHPLVHEGEVLRDKG